MMGLELPYIAAALIGIAIMLYVVLDGFDLGIGILFPFAPDHDARDKMMGSVAPVWDGNETWLILGGGGLFALFPKAYAIALPAFYVPIMLLLFSLIFRGVAFEFRGKAKTSRFLWDAAFFGGSLGAAVAQGFLLGGLLNGVTVIDGRFAGGAFDWLNWFSCLTAISVVIGYALLGACWTILKTEDGVRKWAYRLAMPLALGMGLVMALVSIGTLVAHDEVATRWFEGSNLVYLSPIPVLTTLVFLILLRGLMMRRDSIPFGATLGLFILNAIGLAVGFYPDIIPGTLTITEAATERSSMIFVLIALALTLPMVLFYTAYAYRVFRGKVTGAQTYG